MAGAAEGAAATLGVATAGPPFAGGRQTVTFWHLFGRRRRRAPDRDPGRHRRRARRQRRPPTDPAVGQPVLHEAGAGGSRRLAARTWRSCTPRAFPSFAPAGLLEELTPEMLEPHGLGEDQFQKPWQSCQRELPVGRAPVRDPARHAPVRPLLQHRADRAGGFDGDGRLKRLDGENGLLDACEAVKERTGKSGLSSRRAASRPGECS